MNLIIDKLQIPVEKDGVAEYIKAAALRLNLAEQNISFVKILSEITDFRDKTQFYYTLTIVIGVPDDFDNEANFLEYCEQVNSEKAVINNIKLDQRPIIIGFGPAGMFAALELIENGITPVVFERGKKIEERSIDVQRFIENRVLDTESNIQFGEGGAGSFSDGKLYSKIRNNSEYVKRAMKTLIKFGAPGEIEYIFKPHLGTDVLCKIIVNIRKYILASGGEIHYSSKMTDILITNGKVEGIVINGEKEYRSSIVYLALGHSARETFELLHKKGVAIEQKPISVGVRIEHPAEVINLMKYGSKYVNFPGIGASNYSFNNNADRKVERSVAAFCMCPGGEIVNASSENKRLVVNGMSLSTRSSQFSNSAMVVSCRTDDYKSNDPLAGFEFQKAIEEKAFNAAGESWVAPAQNLTDFLNGRISDNLIPNSFKMGAVAVDIAKIFPEFVGEALLTAFRNWESDFPLFISNHAILLGAETRTTCPVRIKRTDKYVSVNIKNLYPIGEGSGYAGGITSSISDAMRSVEASLLDLC